MQVPDGSLKPCGLASAGAMKRRSNQSVTRGANGVELTLALSLDSTGSRDDEGRVVQPLRDALLCASERQLLCSVSDSAPPRCSASHETGRLACCAATGLGQS